MGHPGERWRNVVTAGQPTRLSGVGHTGTGAGPGSCLYPVLAPPCSRRRERTAPVAVPLVERGTPGALLRHGREAGWKAAPGRGGEGGGQQPTPSGHGLETGGDMPRRASAPPARRCGRTRAPAAPPPGPGPRLAAPAAGAVAHRRVLKHMNHDSQDQHSLPVRWCCETITTIFRRTPCWSRAMIPAVLSSDKRYPW